MTNLESDRSFELIDLRQYLALLWHWSWLIVLAVILAGGMAFAVSKYIPPVYEAKTTILINENPGNSASDYSSIQLSLQLAQTYSQMMTKAPILNEVAKRLGLKKINPNDITAQNVTNMQLINVTVDSRDPVQAANIANTLIAVFREQEQTLQTQQTVGILGNLQSQITETEGLLRDANKQLKAAMLQSDIDMLKTKIAAYQQTYDSLLQNYEQASMNKAETATNIIQIEAATPPDKPIWPNMLENIALAVVVGLVLAAGMIYLIGMSDTTLKTPDEFSKKLGLPVLGEISHYKNGTGLPILEGDPLSPVSEAFRALRANIKFGEAGANPLHTILVVSPSAGEGKSSTAVNLGIAIAQNGKRVCIIDADLRKPKIHQLFQVNNVTGLSDALVETDPEFSVKEIIKSTNIKNLEVLTSGTIHSNPSELLGSTKMSELINEIKAISDVIIIDTPPALAVADASVLLPYVDGVLLVLKAGSSQSSQARGVVNRFHRMDANILGIVINNLSGRYFHYGYYLSSRRSPFQRP